MSKEATSKPSPEPETVFDSTRTFLQVFRIVQFLFLALFAYGIAWGISDLVEYINFPVTGWAIGCIVFGALGVLSSEIQIRRLESQLKLEKP